MKKRVILGLVIFALLGGSVFSQEEAAAKPLNTVTLHASLIGVAISYERAFTPNLSILADTSLNIIGLAFTVEVKGRFYPFAGSFYLEMGIGYGHALGILGMTAELTTLVLTLGFFDISDEAVLNAFVFSPALGWKIPLGNSGLVLPINLGLDFFVGKRGIGIPFDFTPNIRLGLGYSF